MIEESFMVEQAREGGADTLLQDAIAANVEAQCTFDDAKRMVMISTVKLSLAMAALIGAAVLLGMAAAIQWL